MLSKLSVQLMVLMAITEAAIYFKKFFIFS